MNDNTTNTYRAKFQMKKIELRLWLTITMKKKQLPLLIFCEEQLASGINIALLSFVLLLYSYPFFSVCSKTRVIILSLYRQNCLSWKYSTLLFMSMITVTITMKKKQLPLLIFCEEQLASGINIALLSFLFYYYTHTPLCGCFCPIIRTVFFVNYYSK
jgi:hypothetical protein